MPDPESRIDDAAPRDVRRAHRRRAYALLPATLALLAGCAGAPAWEASQEATAAPSAEALAHEAAQQRLHAAVQAAQPGQERLATARRALESLLADDRTEARVLHPYARALLEQIRERQQLALLNERLRRQLDEHAQEFAALHRQNAELQRKLAALADIERGLSPPTSSLRPRTGLPE